MANVTPAGAEIVACYLDENCEVTQCEICLTEVPLGVAERFEGADYVHHFCGLECYAVWRAMHEHKLT